MKKPEIQLKRIKDVWTDHTPWWSKMIRDLFAVAMITIVVFILLFNKEFALAVTLITVLLTGIGFSLPKDKGDK